MEEKKYDCFNQKFLKRLFVGVSLVMMVSLTSCGGSAPKPDSDTSIYRLQFNDKNNFGVNTAKDRKFANAEVIGKDMHIAGTYKNSSVLTFGDQNHNSNYLKLPTAMLDNDNVTIAMWLNMPRYINESDSNRPLFGISFNDGYFYACPYDEETWNSFALHAKFFGSEVNLTKVDPSDKVYHSLAPIDGTLQPLLGGWQLLGFSFTSASLRVYQNGQLALSYPGNYSLKGRGLKDFKIGSATEATGKDFNATITDVRVYNRALNENDYKTEYETRYSDYNTINMNFSNQNLNDTARNFNGKVLDAAKRNVSFVRKDDRDTVYLNGEGDSDKPTRSGFYLPKGVLMGHTELTINMSIFVEPRKNENYKGLRLFDFASNDDDKGGGGKGKRFLAFYYTRYDLNRIRVGTITDKDRYESETNPDSWVSNPDFSLPIRKWMNVTTVFTRTTTRVLIDGEVVCEGTNSPYTSSLFYDFNNFDFFVGRPNQGTSHALHCYLDDFKIYATALNDTEIQDMIGNIHTDNDASAVEKALNNFDISSCMRYGGGRIYPSIHLGDGVLATITSKDNNIIDQNGYLLYANEEQNCPVTIKLSRGNAHVSRDITISVKKNEPGKEVVKNNSFAKESYANDSYQWQMQKATFDWMAGLKDDKLTYMYKVTAGLINNFNYDSSYHSWIRPGCGGEGQFQAQYIGALARATNYSQYGTANLEVLRSKLSNLLNCLITCQSNYPTIWGAGQTGYLNGFSHYCFDELILGSNQVSKEKYGDKLPIPMNETVWVPFYMYHKQLMMCYDVMTYADMGEDTATRNFRASAKETFLKAAHWAKEKVLHYNEKQKEMALRIEYGGMAEAMYAAYRVSLKDNNLSEARDYLKAARFFEESYFLEALYYNSNLLSGIHVNTAIPKFISCCAAYESTGDAFYLKVAANAWDMMVDHMTMSNGGISSIGEHYEEPDHATQARFGEETCCSYNMLRLTDYLYRFTGDAKYMRYFEQVFYNHILPSIDMVGSYWAGDDWPFNGAEHRTHYTTKQHAGKAYVMSTDFGHHITYSSNDDSFWCCLATGTESYTKLTYGNFYTDDDNHIFVNMYNKIDYLIDGNRKLSISGLKNGDNTKGNESVEITAVNGDVDLKDYRFIIPSWVAGDIKMTIDETNVPYTTENGYMIPSVKLDASKVLKITLPMKLNAISQRGYKREDGLGEYSYSLYYGPYMLVPDLGTFPMNEGGTDNGDIYIHNCDGSDQQGQRSYSDVYKDKKGSTEGMISQLVTFAGTSYNDKISKNIETVGVADDHAYNSGLRFDFITTNNGTLKFRPFMDINYERYSFYMYYNVKFIE